MGERFTAVGMPEATESTRLSEPRRELGVFGVASCA